MSAQGSLSREDIQHVSDMRLIALSLKKRWDAERGHLATYSAGLDHIIAECESIIRRGPEEFRFVIEPTVSRALIENELRASVFGHGGRGTV